MAASSGGAVLMALIGNGFITVMKFVAFLFSGSGAMLSESIHSFADTANQGLLFLGIRRSERRPNPLFPYGFGFDRYLYSLFSAIGVFVLGCGVTMYHGVHTLLHPPELKFTWVTWVVLAISFAVEGFVLLNVIRSIKAAKGRKGFRLWLKQTTDPTVPAVLFEDGVAVLGVVAAGVGIGLSSITGSHVPDAIASLVIGGMLGAVAIWLGLVNRRLLLGRAIPDEVEEGVREVLSAWPTVRRVEDFRTRVMGADVFRLKADVTFDGHPLGKAHAPWVREVLPARDDDAAIEAFAEEFGHRIIESLGDEVDRIEHAITERFPRLRFVDLEAE